MRATEVVARVLTKAEYRARNGEHMGAAEKGYVDKHWSENEREAAALLRSLKGQPPHVIDAGEPFLDTRDSLDRMLEAMARS